MDANRFTSVKIFSATMQRDREALGDQIARYLAANPGLQIVDKAVTQSSDRDFHCLTITLFLAERAGEPRPAPAPTRAPERTQE